MYLHLHTVLSNFNQNRDFQTNLMKVPSINHYAHPFGGCHIVPHREVDGQLH